MKFETMLAAVQLLPHAGIGPRVVGTTRAERPEKGEASRADGTNASATAATAPLSTAASTTRRAVRPDLMCIRLSFRNIGDIHRSRTRERGEKVACATCPPWPNSPSLLPISAQVNKRRQGRARYE